jgi:hypothetical protein
MAAKCWTRWMPSLRPAHDAAVRLGWAGDSLVTAACCTGLRHSVVCRQQQLRAMDVCRSVRWTHDCVIFISYHSRETSSNHTPLHRLMWSLFS